MFKILQHAVARGLAGFVLILCFSAPLQAQNFTDSNLPIVMINTDTDPQTNAPLPIADDPRVLASMKIIRHPDGSRNYVADQNNAAFLNYNGRINIEIRGSSSQDLPKKSYGLTTLQNDDISNNNVGLLGMPAENDWVLNSLAFDPSLMRDYISYALSRQIGQYAPRTVFCELLLNGSYAGVYLLQEKIKADSNRVNILKITEDDTSQPNVSGGYITKADKTTGGDPVAWQMGSYAGTTDFIHDLPKPEEVTSQQQTYIHSQFSALAVAAHLNNVSVTNGFPSIIDVPSFIDFMIINELASNVDGYQISTYFHKDRNAKLCAGPVWDLNLTFGNDLFQYGFDRSKTDVWQFSNGDNEGPKFWTDLFNNPVFKCYLSKRWNALIAPGQPLNLSALELLADDTAVYIAEAAVREQAKWGTVPNLSPEVNMIKDFMHDRVGWITGHVGAFTACNAVVLPALVIDKINYNPAPVAGFPQGNDLEFISIQNTGNTAVNLSGIYLSQPGLNYRFAANASVAAGQRIYLASNTATFESRYDFAAFGQFTRNLSNNSQALVLSDAFGNTIDAVTYDDEQPWPDADGNGSYLQLISTTLDNALASSWVAADPNMLTTASTASIQANDFSIYPNPVTGTLTVQADRKWNSVKIYSAQGVLVFEADSAANTLQIDCSSLASGVYMLAVEGAQGPVIKKIIRQ